MLCMGTKKAVTRRRHVRLYNLLFDGAKMRKVFGTCKGEGRKCVAEQLQNMFFAEKGKAHVRA